MILWFYDFSILWLEKLNSSPFESATERFQILVKQNSVLTKAEEKRIDTHCIDAEEPVCNKVGANNDSLQKKKQSTIKPQMLVCHQYGSINTN